MYTMEFQYNCLQRTCYPICLKMAYLHFKLFHLPTSSIIAFFSLGPKPYRFCSLSWVARVSMQYLKVPSTYFIAGTIKKINSFIELIYAPKKIIGKCRHFSYLCQEFSIYFMQFEKFRPIHQCHWPASSTYWHETELFFARRFAKNTRSRDGPSVQDALQL